MKKISTMLFMAFISVFVACADSKESKAEFRANSHKSQTINANDLQGKSNESREHKTLKDLNIPKPYLFDGKTLKELNIALEIIEVVEWDKNIEVLGEIMDTNQYCAHIGSATKNKAQLKEYFLESVFINPDYKGYYGIWQCGYNGKVKLFDKIWDFSSVSGSTTLSRKIPIEQAKKQSNEFYTYCDKSICVEVINLVCQNQSCNPRATIME